jgi:outer membrane protein
MKLILLWVYSMLPFYCCVAQLTNEKVLTIKELFQLADSNAKLIEIAGQGVTISRQKTSIAKSDRLPEISASADAGYLSNVAILNPDFSYHQTVPAPHYSNNYFLETSEVLYKGNYINNNVKRSKLYEQLSVLNLVGEKQDVKILLLGKYLALQQLFNDRIIYLKNIALAERRLKDIRSLRTQGMVTQNDIIRSELQIADFKLDLEDIDNNTTIINVDLCVTLGLSEQTTLLPDASVYSQVTSSKPYSSYLETAYIQQPAMKETIVREAIAEKNISLERAAACPVISLYADNALQRPFLLTLEPINIYYNAYQAGVRINYDISSIYHTREHVQLARLEYEQERTKTALQQQKTIIEVNTAFTNYTEARQRYETLLESQELANDNYRIVEKKYINQLATITDMLDASTAKLSAELRVSNAKINIIDKWYILQKSSGDF